MEMVASWTKSLCLDISQGHLQNYVNDAYCETVRQDEKDLSTWSVLDVGTGNGLLLQELAKQGYNLMCLLLNCQVHFQREISSIIAGNSYRNHSLFHNF